MKLGIHLPFHGEEQPMRNVMYILIVFLSFFLVNAEGTEWKLVWSDEFNYKGLPDESKWCYNEGFCINEEPQYYTRRKENARVENGTLVLECRKERIKNPRYNKDSKDWRQNREYAEYTSAFLQTKSKAGWKYGRIEVRAKCPQGKGLWPAIWMLGANADTSPWPLCGEIDIMEFYGFQPATVYGSVHTAAYNHLTKNAKSSTISVQNLSTEFHTFAIELDSSRIDFFVDSTKYFTYKNEHAGTQTWPFDQELFLIVNCALSPLGSGNVMTDASILPQKFIIDYVRVYQKTDAQPSPSPR
jgi:beta-glucanase (GH16 family)